MCPTSCFKTNPGGDFYSVGWSATTTYITRIARLHASAGARLGTPVWPGKENFFHQFLPRQVSPPATGAWLLNISKWFPVALDKHRDTGPIVIHAGVNDISSRQSEALRSISD
ncbi:hypothetical protein AOLI_G00265630 [Acnodon oligacanthus]